MASHGIARTHRTRTEDQRQQDLDRIAKYRHLEDQIRDQVKLNHFSDPALLHLTTKLLRLNPEYYTIWNVRRRCLTSGFLSRPPAGSWPSRASPTTSRTATTRPSCAASSSSSSAATPPDPKSQQPPRDGKSGTIVEGDEFPSAASDAAAIKSELAFTIPLLLEFPKCYWIWGYRSFLLSAASSLLPATQARDFWTAELALDSKMLSKDRRNFHAWSYRRVIVSALESAALGGTSMTEQEFAHTTRMIHDDLSNFSAWHNRSKLARRLLDERDADDAARRNFLEKELELAREGLNVGPEDQSLWYYHQFLMDQITGSEPQSLGIAPNLGTEERATLVKKELEEIIELVEDYADVKLVYEALLEYSLALKSLQSGGSQGDADGMNEDLLGWLEKLRELDPMRRGRWDDIQKSLTK